ncbi:zinc-ribbon domain-containing protein [Tychonema sp. LEGE 07203]|uniref:zinc-ribbon domain-containing protein n=1 Tax=Tychonema sp. LEGE 07203 TaxID=1828671 RepID=UPI0018827EB8|nr:zinc-ribbon domain-containing protein [Tychonema sp. LEGE 07203]MBE9092701.1 hypothetical protein [Tychonema sp. LEGE 07203]
MSDIHLLSAENFNSREMGLLDLLRQYPLRVNEGVWVLSEPPKNLVEYATNNVYLRNLRALNTLEEKGLTQKQNNEIHLSHLGQKVAEHLQKVAEDIQEKRQQSIDRTQTQAKLAKSKAMLELYKQGLTYLEIGVQYKITTARVRQILKFNPAFHEYLTEKKQAQKQAQEEKAEKKRQERLAKSIITLYPERVAQLWDNDKNGSLKPEDVNAKSSIVLVWFKCPIDGNSWQKKTKDITTSWNRGSSGCPKCAGRKNKRERHPALTEVYSELISQYWDYEKNNELGMKPSEITLRSNKIAWFRCPHDGSVWQSSIVLTVNRWSKGNTGCRVCNGRDKRQRGKENPRKK